MLEAFFVVCLLGTVIYYERRLSNASRPMMSASQAEASVVRSDRAEGLAEMDRVCGPVYGKTNGRSRVEHAIDFWRMRYEHTSIFDVMGHRHYYALHRSEDGDWRMKLLEVEALGEDYDNETGKLMHGWRFLPQVWADREYPVEDSWFEGEVDRAYRLEERAEILEWLALPENLVPWVETAYQRCVEFFRAHPGWTPATTMADLPANSGPVWSPPQSHDEAEVHASVERMKQARLRTHALKREQNKLTNALLKEHRAKQP